MPLPFDPTPSIERMPDATDVRQAPSPMETFIVWSCAGIALTGVLLMLAAGVVSCVRFDRVAFDREQETRLGSSYRSASAEVAR